MNKVLFISTVALISAQWCFSQGLELIPRNEYEQLKSPPIHSGWSDFPARHVISSRLFPTPGNQGMQPSCVGWAVGFGFMSFYQAAINNSLIDNNTIFSPSYIYHNIRACDICSCGTRIDQALDFLKNYGNVPINHFPYNEYDCDKPSHALQQIARNYKISEWFRMENTQNLAEIKTYVLNDMPVIVSVKADASFQSFKNKTENDIFFWSNRLDYGFHAMLVVGYDDDKKAFKLLNSWGTDWGTDGYCWIDYQSFRSMVQEGFIVEKNYGTTTEPPPTTKATISIEKLRPYVLSERIRNDRYYYTLGFIIDDDIKPLIEKIVYVYDHPSFINKYSTSYAAPNFTDSYEGWGCLTDMQAIVYLKDGNSVDIRFNACEILNTSSLHRTNITSVDINPVVTVEPTNRKDVYYFRVQLRGIENIKDQVVKVVYDMDHSSFKDRYLTTHDRFNNFELGYEGWGCLERLGVTIYFKNNTTQTFDINMCKTLDWL